MSYHSSNLGKSIIALSIVLALGACSQEPKQKTATTTVAEVSSDTLTKEEGNLADNPFFQVYDTPFQIPPFNKIKNEHYMPAFEQGMQDHLAEIDVIVNNSDAPTFENTVEELERAGKQLAKVQRVFFNLTGSNTNSELQELQRQLSPLLSAHYDKVNLNKGLFKRIEAVFKTRDSLNLSAEKLKFLKDTRKGFVRSGALLTTEQKNKISELNGKLSLLSTAYGQNLLAETNGFELILDKSDLVGLSAGIVQAAANTAQQKMDAAQTDEDKAKYQNKYVFTPHRSSMY
jgi:peptidyl-dipeptidase Dcp